MPYTIKQVSEVMNLPISTIRYYDKEGLLPFLERKEIVQKQMNVINHILWYYQTAIEAGTEAIHKENNVKCNE